MLIKLPIVINDKIHLSLFQLIKYDTYFILNRLNSNEQIIQILLYNNINYYEKIDIYLPLQIDIIDNYLFCVYFFILYLSNNKLGFFNKLNNIFVENYLNSN